jgi:very-short-patch-repair endonuclease
MRVVQEETMMQPEDQVLVTIMRDRLDFECAKQKGWYRIPVASVHRYLQHRWPPQWLAFYHTKAFAAERYAVHYYAPVTQLRTVQRRDLFPNQEHTVKDRDEYYQVCIGPLQNRAEPLVSPRLRRITFIPTTGQKFLMATDVNDLFDDSPLEDVLWQALKARAIPADRQELIEIGTRFYIPDFTICCVQAHLIVEADGDQWHANRDRAARDNMRDNALKTAGYQMLRFSTKEIRERLNSYCIPTIAKNINRLGGIKINGIPHKIDLSMPEGIYQRNLFELLSSEQE